jgi:trehalose 6-phosphate synthase/phosphatase
MLAPAMIRELAEAEDINIRLGFFLHIPFPPWDIFRIFPRNEEILLGLLGDLKA